ncbi:MAG: UbiA family prenyltransferase [Parcubacteria group bacterium]
MNQVVTAFMQKMNKWPDSFSEKAPSPLVWFLSFAGIIAVRLFLDNFVAQQGKFTLASPTDAHNLLFFLLVIISLWLWLALCVQENPLKLSNLVLWASLIIIFPPIFDMLKTGGGIFWSPYLFSSFHDLGPQCVSFLGNLPTGMVYFGTRIMAAVCVLAFLLIIFLKTKNVWRSLAGALGAYGILFFFVSFPSWLSFVYHFFQGSKKITAVTSIDIVQFVGAPKPIFGVEFAESLKHALSFNLNLIYFPLLLGLLAILFFWINKDKFRALAGNARLPQLLGHTGLFFAGLWLGYLAYPGNLNLNIFSAFAALNLLAAIWLAWLASVAVNDIYDFSIDAISNQDRPLPKKIITIGEYWQIGLIFFILSLVGGFIVNPKFAALLLVYQVIAWIYSSPPFHLKRLPVAATLLAAADLIIVLFIGFALISGDNNIQGLSWRVILLLLLTLTLALPLKDFKDIEADKKHNIWTLPVLLGEEKGRLFMAAWAFVSFVLTVFFLNEFRLFWWAVLCGAGAFLVIVNKKTKPRQFFWWVLGIAAAYGLILVKIIFL